MLIKLELAKSIIWYTPISEQEIHTVTIVRYNTFLTTVQLSKDTSEKGCTFIPDFKTIKMN